MPSAISVCAISDDAHAFQFGFLPEQKLRGKTFGKGLLQHKMYCEWIRMIVRVPKEIRKYHKILDTYDS